MTLLQQNSLSETGFKAYTTYLALKRHFTSSYDYHKYNGKVNASFESFSIRKDAFTFQRLGKQRDFEGLILSNLIVNQKAWAGNLLDDSARQIYLDWKKRNDSLTHHFKSSLSILDEDFQSNFIVRDGQYPHLVDLHLQKQISIEVFALLVKLTNTKSYWNEKVVDKVLFPDIITKIDKYIPFINYSNEKMSNLIKDHFF